MLEVYRAIVQAARDVGIRELTMADQSLKEKIVDAVFSERGYVLVVAGFVLLLIGFLGQTNWFPLIPDEYRWAAIVIGVCLLLAGIALLFIDGQSGKNKYGVEIFYPKKGAPVDEKIEINGRIGRRRLPTGKELWLLRIYPNRKEFVPMKQIVPDREGAWETKDCALGGIKNDRRIIGAYLVDESAKVLIESRQQAEKEHNKWMDELGVPKDKPNRYLMPIKADVSMMKNMEMCLEIEVRRN
jgi:hypothetical protein